MTIRQGFIGRDRRSCPAEKPFGGLRCHINTAVAVRMTEGMNDVDKRKVLSGNAARVFKLDV